MNQQPGLAGHRSLAPADFGFRRLVDFSKTELFCKKADESMRRASAHSPYDSTRYFSPSTATVWRKPLRVFAALAAVKTGLDWRGEMGSGGGPRLWNFQLGRVGGGLIASAEMGW
jgi:hypothetical protein